MAEFGSFEYGTSTTYGSSATGSAVESIAVVDENKIAITFTGDGVVINEALISADNYVITLADGSPTDIAVRTVTPSVVRTDVSLNEVVQAQSVKTTGVELLTDYHEPGVKYRVTISNITSTAGLAVPSAGGDIEARRTKVDSILKSLPSHYTKSVGSTLRGIVAAIGLEDDRIGGSLSEDLQEIS